MQTKSSTIRELLVSSEAQFGPKDAIRYKAKASKGGKKETVVEAKTYTEFKNDTECFSAALAALSEQEKHIAILGPNSYSWLTAYFGTVNSGSVAVPLDALLPSEELCDLINRADVTTLVYDKSKEDAALAAMASCPGLKHIIGMQNAPSPQGDAQCHDMWDLIGKQQPGFSYEPKPEQLATIMFTSGTTGKSKGVMLTHQNMAENATCLDMRIETGTVILSVLPVHHAYCLAMDILKGISLGSVICINDSLLRIAKNITLFEPNMILMVPLMIETFAKKLEEVSWIPAPLVRAKVFGKQFHTVCSGGAYLNPAYLDVFHKYGIEILQGYGMTECSPVISTNLSWDNKAGSVGKLMPNCEAKTVEGELWVKGTSVMQGYYNAGGNRSSFGGRLA